MFIYKLKVGGRHNAVAWIFLLHPELDPNLQVESYIPMMYYMYFAKMHKYEQKYKNCYKWYRMTTGSPLCT